MGTTLETVVLEAGYWRHSTATGKVLRCRSDGSWSPCLGGGDAGSDGDGYCAEGFRGPRCELCNTTTEYSQHFDKIAAKCFDCGDVTAQSAAAFCVMVLFVFVSTGAGSDGMKSSRSSWEVARQLASKWQHVTTLWRRAGMRCKVKLAVGVYQCLAAIPSVFDVTAPDGLDHYSEWLDIIEWPSDFVNIVLPSACLGRYSKRLLIGSLWPLVLILAAAAIHVAQELLQDRWTADRTLVFRRRKRLAVLAGLQRTLPFTLILTFLLVPSTATRIFKAFLCDPIEYDMEADETRRYLRYDLAITCDSDEYRTTETIAAIMIFVWPCGCDVVALTW